MRGLDACHLGLLYDSIWAEYFPRIGLLFCKKITNLYTEHRMILVPDYQ